MEEIIQRQELNREKIFELFKNKTFKEYSILFYESKKTIAQVLKELHIKGRGTINKQLKLFRQNGEYDPRYILTEASWKPPQKKILFTHRILIDYLFFHAKETGQKLDLTEQEIGLLLELMDMPGVDLVMRKKNRNWPDVLTKLSFTLLFFIAYREKIGKKKIRIKDIERLVEILRRFTQFTKEEREAYFQDVQDFNQRAGGQIYQTAVKILELNIPVSLGSQDIYLMMIGAMEAALSAAKAVFKVCKTACSSLERRLIMKAKRPGIIAALEEFGIDLEDLKER